MHVGALICLDAWRKSHQLSLLRMSCWKLVFGFAALGRIFFFFFFYSLGVTRKATIPAWKLNCIYHQKAFICKLVWWGGGGSNAACAKGWCTCRSCIGISVSEECGYSDVNGSEALRSITWISVAAQRLCSHTHSRMQHLVNTALNSRVGSLNM